jgi:hypothetical protein
MAQATEVGTSRTFGLGVQLFEPTALIGKLFLDRNDALDFGVGFWGYGRCYDNNGPYACNNGNQYFSIHFDYLYEEPIVDTVVRLDWHVGAGGRMAFNSYYNGNGTARCGPFCPGPPRTGPDLPTAALAGSLPGNRPGLVDFPPLAFDIDVGLGVRAYF